MIFFALANAFITRVVFCLHVIISVSLVVVHTRQMLYWCFLTGVMFMFIEMLYIMIKRKGREYKLFWPGCFLYLSTIVPVIWVMELDLLQHRLDQRYQLTTQLNKSTLISSQLNFGGYNLTASLNTEVAAKKVCELGVILVIIFGRWLLPRGKLTRDQLSNLLLLYIGLGADILDLFEPLTHRNVKYNVVLTYTTLALFSWSMLQFCLIAIATAGSDDNSGHADQQEMEKRINNGVDIESRQQDKSPVAKSSIAKSPIEKSPIEKSLIDGESTSSETSFEVHIERDNESVASSATNAISTHDACNEDDPQNHDAICNTKPRYNIILSADLVGMLTSLLMHDGPFLVFRLILVGMYHVTTEIHLFFTAKNALTVTIMLYKLNSFVHNSRVVCPDEKHDRCGSSKVVAM